MNVAPKKPVYALEEFTISSLTGMIKKVVQQGRSDFDVRIVLPVREHGKMAKTPLAAFFNIPFLQMFVPGFMFGFAVSLWQ